jgi:hypothetical protein
MNKRSHAGNRVFWKTRLDLFIEETFSEKKIIDDECDGSEHKVTSTNQPCVFEELFKTHGVKLWHADDAEKSDLAQISSAQIRFFRVIRVPSIFLTVHKLMQALFRLPLYFPVQKRGPAKEQPG